MSATPPHPRPPPSVPSPAQPAAGRMALTALCGGAPDPDGTLAHRHLLVRYAHDRPVVTWAGRSLADALCLPDPPASSAGRSQLSARTVPLPASLRSRLERTRDAADQTLFVAWADAQPAAQPADGRAPPYTPLASLPPDKVPPPVRESLRSQLGLELAEDQLARTALLWARERGVPTEPPSGTAASPTLSETVQPSLAPPPAKRRKVPTMQLSVQTDPRVLDRRSSGSAPAADRAAPPASAPAANPPWGARTSATRSTAAAAAAAAAVRPRSSIVSVSSASLAPHSLATAARRPIGSDAPQHATPATNGLSIKAEPLPPIRSLGVGSRLPSTQVPPHRRTGSYSLTVTPRTSPGGPRSAGPLSPGSRPFDWPRAPRPQHHAARSAHPCYRRQPAPWDYSPNGPTRASHPAVAPRSSRPAYPWDESPGPGQLVYRSPPRAQLVSAPPPLAPLPPLLHHTPSHAPKMPPLITTTPTDRPLAHAVRRRRRPEIRLDQVHVRQSLGQGTRSQVLLIDTRRPDEHAEQRHGDLYAVKVSPRGKRGDPDLLSRLDHDSIVAFYMSFQRGPRDFFILEFVPGGTLFSLLDRLRHMKPAMVRFYIAGVLQALEYLHARHVVHGDIKPENVLLAADGYIKVGGFARAKVVLPRPPASPYELSDEPCHTPFVEQQPSWMSPPFPLERTEPDEYTPPEVVKQTSYTPAVDFWALGIMLFELLVGHTPFAPGAQRRRTHVPLATSPWSDSTKTCTSNPTSATSSTGTGAGSKHVSPLSPRAPWAHTEGVLKDRILKGITGIDVADALAPAFDAADSTAPSADLQHVTHLLFGLLNPTPSLRLGTLTGGPDDVKRHLWFGARATASPIEPADRHDLWSQPLSRVQRNGGSTGTAQHLHLPGAPATASSDTAAEFDWAAFTAHKLAPPLVPAPPALVPAHGALRFADWEAGQDS